MTNLERARIGLHDEARTVQWSVRPADQGATALLIATLTEMQSIIFAFGMWGLSQQITRQLERANNPQVGAGDFAATVDALQMNIVDELAQAQFLGVPPSRVPLYLTPGFVFGADTLAQFDGIFRDVRDAYQCLAVEQWTGAVFHGMRILEHGLWWLAAELGMAEPTEQNWGQLLDQIEKKIQEVKGEPNSSDKTERLTFYSQAAVQFGYFKDAWRNHTSHSRVSYDAQEAEKVLGHVRDFMGQLAARRAGQGSLV